MRFISMVAVNSKRYFKDLKNVIMMLILPFICVAAVSMLLKDGNMNSNEKVAIVNSDSGIQGKELIKKLGVIDIYEKKEQALKELRNYNYMAVYEVPKDFSDKLSRGDIPEITAYKLESGNSTQLFETNLQNKISEMLKVQILSSKNIIIGEENLDKNLINIDYKMKPGLLSQGEFLPIMLILFYLVTFSGNFSADLLTLRKDKILERFLSTRNKGYEIMGSLYLSMLIVQTVLYSASFLLMDLVFKYKFENFGMLLLNIILMSMVSISLVVMITRIFKEGPVASLILTMITMIMFFAYILSVIAETSSKVPEIMTTLSKLTPFYWALDSIEKSVIFPNAIILVLMALVFFSAGSIRYSSFAKEV